MTNKGGNKLLDIGLDNVSEWTPKSKDNKSKNKQDYIILKSCTAKETINKIKKQPTEWEKIFTNLIRG